MAVTNTWLRGHTTISTPQLRPSLSSPSPSSSSSSSSAIKFTKKTFLTPLRNSKLHCYCSNYNTDNNNNNITNTNNATSLSASSSADWDWNRWTRHFSEIEQAQSYAGVLKFQLEEAIDREDFAEAAKLKRGIAEATSKDTIAEIMYQLKSAVNEERYHDASKLCQNTGSGLVGWWVGYSDNSDDPFGRVIRIVPGMGRLIAQSYSPRQLVTASPGPCLFEIFVVKEDDDTYTMQVVYLKQNKGNNASASLSSDSNPTKELSSTEIENAQVIDVKVMENETDEKNIDFEVAAEEGIRSVINYIKDKLPDLKIKVMKSKVTEEEEEEEVTDDEEDDSVKQVMEEDSNLDEDEKAEEDMKLFIGGVLHNKEDNPSKNIYVRIPANIKDMERDSFVLHIPPKSNSGNDENVEVSRIAAQSMSQLMPPDVAKAFLVSDKVSPKVSRDVRNIVKLALKEAQKRSTLSEYTIFNRIILSKGDLDPFDGLYVGAFGPYGTELVQLRHKYGNWNVKTGEESESGNVDFFEYVEAVKLTGDLNVPAGQVTFRAKIGKGKRLSKRGMYPEELGVVGSYIGEGRIADFGFKNPKWVEGELLQLNGKGMGQYVKGADLGFLYVIPEQSFLVLFNRVKLPE